MALYPAAAGVILSACLVFGADGIPVRHEHAPGWCEGTLSVTGGGIAFQSAKHHWTWTYGDIQELKAGPDEVEIVTYTGRTFLGADATFRFRGEIPAAWIETWSKTMDQRFVAEVALRDEARWSIPVKHLGRGSQGVLALGSDALTYQSAKADDSRTWRFEDIANISSSGPFELTITTFERARWHYGDRRDFHFQLKEPLPQAKYDALWLEIEKRNGRIQ